MFKYIGIFLLTLLLVGCAGKPKFDVRTATVAYKDLTIVQAPKGDPFIIAVYDFLDMTGQKKPGGNFASMSTAVTQGSYQLLIKALQDAGDGKWFRIVERASLSSTCFLNAGSLAYLGLDISALTCAMLSYFNPDVAVPVSPTVKFGSVVSALYLAAIPLIV